MFPRDVLVCMNHDLPCLLVQLLRRLAISADTDVPVVRQGVPAREIMAELFGKKTGICRGQGGSMHMFSKKHGLVSRS